MAIGALLLRASAVPNLVFSEDVVLDTVVRKLGHFVAFAMLAAAACTALRPWMSLRLAVVTSIVAASGLAVADELRQVNIAGRMPSAIDVALDASGALAGAHLYRRSAALHGRNFPPRGQAGSSAPTDAT